MPSSAPLVSLVVPCYNESTILADSAAQLLDKLRQLINDGAAAPDSFILLVNDGSTDSTWEIIADLHARNPGQVRGLKLAANRGHQNALLAGLLQAAEWSDLTISLDADLQDDIAVLDLFLQEYARGSDIVYGVRSDRSSDSFFKRFSAEAFYKLLAAMGVKTVYNHADYRLMSRRAVLALAEYREVNLYLRGIIPLLGYKQSVVTYQRLPTSRPTHYPLKKMLALAWNGITSFSVKPIQLISTLGAATTALSLLLLLRFLFVKIFTDQAVPGWTSMVVTVTFFGGIQLLSIGVIGEYIAKIYLEVKHRPRFSVEALLGGKPS